MIKFLMSALLIVHGLVHILGFLIFFEFMEVDTLKYTTRVLWGRFEIGRIGIRLLGVVWLLVMVAFIAAGVGLLVSAPWWLSLTLWTTAASAVLCLLGLPDTVFGLIINGLIFAILYFGGTFSWF
jgi:hypothetical protein